MELNTTDSIAHLNFNDDTRRMCFNVTIINDNDSEQIESFNLQLEVDSASALSITLVPGITTVHIVDDDCKHSLTFCVLENNHFSACIQCSNYNWF